MKTRTSRYASFKNSRFGRRRLFLLFLIILLAVGLGLVLGIDKSADKTDGNTTSKPASSKGEPAQDSNTATPSPKTPGNSTSDSAPSGEAPKTPYGNFVSSHSARLNDAEFSTCITSTGAKCKISFSKDSTTKTLDEKTTDADGAAYWTWKPQDLGLTAGSWQITATATMNGKISSATDNRPFVIQP
ncbi:hypothetical protein HYW36_00170 [Candidatus Saccharibacteria bacterium]|nr:hypothetical protein [Candidatus Saccharibacteria bacterium]